MKHFARKRFGQHFLTDRDIIERIVEAIAPQPGQALVEIGPGLGALTQPLLARCGLLCVIELDRDLAAALRRRAELEVIEADVLAVDFTALAQARGAALRVVGNLPYNISSPILFHLLAAVSHIADQHFMLQAEVVQRMTAVPATKAYGRLSVMMQWRYALEHLIDVAPDSFEPPPRVRSAVVRMQPRQGFAAVQPEHLSELVRVAFSQRRKLLRHTLGRWLEERQFGGHFNLQRRAEEVPVAQYLDLAAACAGLNDAGCGS
ncbi:MAG: 16S rRNA (adenine(1518)-N(6)/adenine(1519)-N(6))-dimethyltransferase RsmA [Burkholderiaceae bacterium]